MFKLLLLLLGATLLSGTAIADPLDCRKNAESMYRYERVVRYLPGSASLRLDYMYCQQLAAHRGYFSEFDMLVGGKNMTRHIEFDFYPDSIQLNQNSVVIERSSYELVQYEEDRLVLQWKETWSWSHELALFRPTQLSTDNTVVKAVVDLRRTIERFDKLTADIEAAQERGAPREEIEAHQQAVKLSETRTSPTWIRERLANILRRSLRTAEAHKAQDNPTQAADVLAAALSARWSDQTMLDLAQSGDSSVSSSSWEHVESILAASTQPTHLNALRKLRTATHNRPSSEH